MHISLRKAGEEEGDAWRDVARTGGPAAELNRLSKTERTMIAVRWAGVAFGLIQTLTFYLPYPPVILSMALGLVALLAVGNVAVMIAHSKIDDVAGRKKLSVASMALDAAVIVGFTFAYTFDEATSIWALIYIIPLEGAIRFGLKGSIGWMAAAAAAYFLREVYGTTAFGNEFLPTSISFRMGLGVLVGWVAGSMSSNLAKERRELENANSKLGSLLHALANLGEGMVIAEPNKILFANEAMETILGYGREELMDLPSLLVLVAPESVDDIVQRMAREPGADPEGERFDVVAIHRDGRRVHLEVALKPLDDPHSARVVAVVRDVTERKKAESRVSDALERERHAVTRLQALDSARSDFLSTVSHELRTPVTTIGGFAYTLMQRWDALRDSQRRDFVRRISLGAGQLNRLIAELLDFSRLERGDAILNLKEVSVEDILLDTLVEAGMVLEDHWVRCMVDPGLHSLVDPNAFSRILENLLTNAAKFSPAGTTVTIRARAHPSGEVLFEVADQGMGVPSEDRHRIFDRFFRVQRGDTSPSGTGIGLAVVKEFVQAHGGQVWASPNEPAGTVFSFTLKQAGLITSRSAEQVASLA